jgi:hypothetical protein
MGRAIISDGRLRFASPQASQDKSKAFWPSNDRGHIHVFAALTQPARCTKCVPEPAYHVKKHATSDVEVRLAILMKMSRSALPFSCARCHILAEAGERFCYEV